MVLYSRVNYWLLTKNLFIKARDHTRLFAARLAMTDDKADEVDGYYAAGLLA